MRCALDASRQKVGAALACCVAFMMLPGCETKDHQTIPVRGKVTFAGGPCPAGGAIAFSPVQAGANTPRRPGSAEFQADGEFEATSFAPGDGLLPGRYRAIISCWKGEPSNKDPGSFERLNHIPRDYQPIEFDVDASATVVELTLDVPLKK
ncbi:hypothetical protein [Lacipirellula sp.]|uniref:hypothetical protein n=1 Tax=Lacipirellula sp. TaxID=2691419 RepID=UPI003D103A97